MLTYLCFWDCASSTAVMVEEMLMNGRGIIGPRCKSLLIYLAIVAVNEEHVILIATLTVYTSLNCKDWRAGVACVN